MGRRYEDVSGEPEEVFPLKGERLVELPQALRIIAERTSPVGAEPAAVDEQLLGRVLAEPVTLTGTAQPATILQAGTVRGSLHLGLLAQSGPERVPVRRPVRAFVLPVTAGSEQEAAALLLQLSGELTNWPVEVRSPAGLALRPLGNPGQPTEEDFVQAACFIYHPPHALPRERLDLVRVLPVGGRQTGPPPGPSAAEEPTR